MYVQELQVKSFRHLADVHLGPFLTPSAHSDLVVLAGPNGGGKSSILELIGFALSNSWSLGWSLSRSFPTNSFEVALAVTSEERGLIREYLASNPSESYSERALRYFDDNSTYYRSYNFSEGKYQQNASLYNEVHNLASNALRNHYSRPMGFFLKADRYYPSGAFDRKRLFNYPQLMKRDHIWSLAFNTSDVQYKDMFEFLVQQRYHYFRHLGAFHHKISAGVLAESGPPIDPLMFYDDLLQQLFPGYRFADTHEEIPSDLFIQLPSGEIIRFHDLSSGEKEVFFILSFFIRHDVTHAVIVVDEPELHLHPELARKLVRTMQTIRPGNQLWLATHNTEIIDEAGRDRVLYVARDSATSSGRVMPAVDESHAHRTLKDMFGYSGYIGVAKRMVFLEGARASSDRKVFSAIFPDFGSSIKFIPAQSSDNQSRLNAAILAILESDLGVAHFYLIRDRDYLSAEAITKYATHRSGRIYVLGRHEIENYLLSDDLIARVQTDIFGKPTTAERVSASLKRIARRLSGETLRDMIAFRLNLLYRPQDFSLGEMLAGQAILDDGDRIAPERVASLRSTVDRRIADVNAVLQRLTSREEVDSLVGACQEQVCRSLSNDDEWRSFFPGKRLLEEYARDQGLGDSVVLQNSLIKELSTRPELVPEELHTVVSRIARGESLAA